MNCAKVQQLLSAYYDGELRADTQSQVREHLGQCGSCAAELAGFEGISRLARDLQVSVTPEAIWSRLERELDEATVPIPNKRSRLASLVSTRGMVLAATVLIAVGAGWLAYGTWSGHEDHRGFIADFGHYLDEFRQNPEAAQQILIAKYDGESVDGEQASRLVGYRPLTSQVSHDQYKVKSIHVLKMPCCTCVQTICERSNGSTVAIFEHDDENAEWFGDRPETMANCSGQPCRLFDVNDRIAASWKSGTRNITVIGARNVDEVGELVEWLRVES